MLRVILVTSDLTYVPHNYTFAFEKIFKGSGPYIVGVCLIQVDKISTIKTAIKLLCVGCWRFALTIFKNLFSLYKDPRQELFKKNNIPLVKVHSVNEANFIEWVKKQNVDLILNMRTRSIYKKEILHTPRLGCLNVHHGLLPKYRGTMCDLYALSENRPAGFSIHKMTEKIDAGDIVHIQQVNSGAEKNYFRYLKEASIQEGKIISDLLGEIDRLGKIPPSHANDSEGSVYSKTPGLGGVRMLQKKGMLL